MKNVVRALQRSKRRMQVWRGRHVLDALLSRDSEEVQAIARAIRDAAAARILPEEREFIAYIENRRSELVASNDTVEVVDYGAGDRDSNRSGEEMKNGVLSVASVSDVSRVSKSPFWCLVLFKLLRHLKPGSCLELGTCVGISASYQAAALALNGEGRVVTLEGAPQIADIAKETLSKARLDNATVVVGPFHETYRDTLNARQPIDFLFNDGHHDHDALLKYFADSLPFLSENAVVVFDDIAWSRGMESAWRRIEQHSRVDATVNLGAMGIAVVVRKGRNENYSIPL